MEQFPALDLGVEHISDLVPGDGHGDGTQEDLLSHGPPGVNLGTAVEVDSVGGGWDLLHHQLGLLLLVIDVSSSGRGGGEACSGHRA